MSTLAHGVSAVIHDLRFALRALTKERGFALTALLTIAICIGGNSAIFSIVRSVLLKPLPIPDAERVLILSNTYQNAGGGTTPSVDAVATSVPDYFDRLREIDVFEQQALYRRNTMTLGAREGAERVTVLRATPSFYRLVSAGTDSGRLFLDSEGEVGNDTSVILSYGFWQGRYGANPSVVGQHVRLDGISYRVVGIMDRHFQYLWDDIDIWLPLSFTDQQRADAARHSNNWIMIARLRTTATLEQAQQQIDALNGRNVRRYPQFAKIVTDSGFRTVVARLQETVVRDIRSTLYLLWGGALFVLLVGVVNLANLVLARGFGRLRELATRTALGASLPRIAGQLVTETVLVAVLGGVAGLIAGWWALRSLALLRLDWLPRRHEIGLDGPAALFTVVLSVCVGVLMAVVPVARLSRLQVSDALRDADRSTTGG
jgi:predicted permease